MSRIFFLFAILLFSSSVYALADDIYSVENVIVDVNGKSPSDARNNAVSSARRNAFATLLGRLNLNSVSLASVSDSEISDMVKSEQISDEKISGNKYSASFNISFAKSFVDYVLEQKNSSKNAEKSNKKFENKSVENHVLANHLLIPARIQNGKIMLWGEDNDWRKFLQKSLDAKLQRSFVIPDADVENLAVVNQENLRHVDYLALESMIEKYGADSAYIAIFSFDEVAKKANVEISQIKKLQKKQTKLSFVNSDNLKSDFLLGKIADRVVDYVVNAEASEARPSRSTLVTFDVALDSLDSWLDVKNKIENSNLVDRLNILSISQDNVVISVHLIDSELDVVESFKKIGLALNKKTENFYKAFNN